MRAALVLFLVLGFAAAQKGGGGGPSGGGGNSPPAPPSPSPPASSTSSGGTYSEFPYWAMMIVLLLIPVVGYCWWSCHVSAISDEGFKQPKTEAEKEVATRLPITRGISISAELIEYHIKRLPGVKDACVEHIHQGHGQWIVAFVTTSASGRQALALSVSLFRQSLTPCLASLLSQANTNREGLLAAPQSDSLPTFEWQERLSASLPSISIPKCFIAVDTIPRRGRGTANPNPTAL